MAARLAQTVFRWSWCFIRILVRSCLARLMQGRGGTVPPFAPGSTTNNTLNDRRQMNRRDRNGRRPHHQIVARAVPRARFKRDGRDRHLRRAFLNLLGMAQIDKDLILLVIVRFTRSDLKINERGR